MFRRRVGAAFRRNAWLDDRQVDHWGCQQLGARITDVEPRARSTARAAPRRLRRLPQRDHHRPGDRRDHPQRRILRTGPCQPLRLPRRLSHRRQQAQRGYRSSRVPQSRRQPRRDPALQGGRSTRLNRCRRRALLRAAPRWIGRDPPLEDPPSVTTAEENRGRTLLAFAAVTSLFFAWGFITSNNDPLIVALRAAFSLDYTEALLTQIVFFVAYGLLSLPAAWVSSRLGPVDTILMSLALMAGGCLGVVIGVHFGSLVMLGDPALRRTAGSVLEPGRRNELLGAVDRAFLIMAALL